MTAVRRLIFGSTNAPPVKARHRSKFPGLATSRRQAWRKVHERPIAVIRRTSDNQRVRAGGILDMLSKRAPAIVIFSLCAALVGAWTGAPVWLARGAAIFVGGLALLLLAARGRRHQLKTPHELGFTHKVDWIAYEIAGKGTPPGYYLLGFFGFLTIFLTGFRSPYAMLAWAGFALGVVWGIVNADYPVDEESE
jgi:hypothetical protein